MTMHKCSGCPHKGEHQEMGFKPFGVCTKETNLIKAEQDYNAEKCPYKAQPHQKGEGMNREIIHRGKRTDNGEWIEGNLLVLDGEEYRIATSCLQGDDDILIVCAYEVDPATVGQFAGWTDRRGTNVFEGDIICGFNDIHQRQESYLVKWCYNNGFYLVNNCGVEWHPEHVENQEIIGNIHDHPSLLQG